MRKHLSYLAFPVACLAVLVGLVACGGSGGNPVDTTPTVQEAAAAVTQASTPAEGEVAATKVLRYLGVTESEVYQDLPAADRQQFNEAFGASLALDYTLPMEGTYGEALESFAEELETDTTVEAALTALKPISAPPRRMWPSRGGRNFSS
ncbi:MAG: hypothetical protein ACO1SV_20610 [Fimbriimonas sp.]